MRKKLKKDCNCGGKNQFEGDTRHRYWCNFEKNKTDDEKFVEWLKPSEKEFEIFDCKEYESVGNWEGRVYERQPDRVERFLMWLLNKYSKDAIRPNQYTFLDK